MKKFSILFVVVVIAFIVGAILVPSDPNFSLESIKEMFQGDAKDTFINNCNGFAKKVVDSFDNDMEGNATAIEETINSYPYNYNGVVVIYSSYGAYEYSINEDYNKIRMYVAVDKEHKTTYIYGINKGDPDQSEYMVLQHVYNADKKIKHGVVNADSIEKFDYKTYTERMIDESRVCADLNATLNKRYMCIDRKGELIF